METVLEPIIRSPRLPQYIEQLQAALAHEQEKRQQFYDTVREGDKAEFINGEVLMHSPVKLIHNSASGTLYALLQAYVDAHDLGVVAHEKLMISLTRNDYEPDVCFWREEKATGFDPRQMRFPAPDFIAEVISESTEHVDRGVKFEDYAAHGVAEYWLIDPESQTVEQYLLNDETYTLAIKAADGTLKSSAIAGFVIPVRAIFDSAERQRTLRNLLA